MAARRVASKPCLVMQRNTGQRSFAKACYWHLAAVDPKRNLVDFIDYLLRVSPDSLQNPAVSPQGFFVSAPGRHVTPAKYCKLAYRRGKQGVEHSWVWRTDRVKSRPVFR